MDLKVKRPEIRIPEPPRPPEMPLEPPEVRARTALEEMVKFTEGPAPRIAPNCLFSHQEGIVFYTTSQFKVLIEQDLAAAGFKFTIERIDKRDYEKYIPDENLRSADQGAEWYLWALKIESAETEPKPSSPVQFSANVQAPEIQHPDSAKETKPALKTAEARQAVKGQADPLVSIDNTERAFMRAPLDRSGEVPGSVAEGLQERYIAANNRYHTLVGKG